MDEREIDFLKTQDEKYLKGKLEQWSKESESQIVVTSQEESAEEARKKADEEFADKEPTMEEFTKHIAHKFRNKKKDEK